MYYIGYDLGSSFVKIALLDSKTNKQVSLIKEPSSEMKIISLKDNWAEQDPKLWWKYICDGTKKLINKTKINKDQIKAIGISYQMHGLVLLDNKNKLLRNSIIWCDSRAVNIGNKAEKEIGIEKFRENLLNSPGNFTASKLKWVKEKEPDLYKRVKYFMLPGDYIAFKLTGEISTTINGLSEAILWDFKSNSSADWLLDYFEIDKNFVPQVVNNFEEQGRINKKASEESGLPLNIPVKYRAGDQPNNALSLNVLNPGEIAATAGTSGVLFSLTDILKTNETSRINHFAHVNYSKKSPVVGKLLCINGTGIQYKWLREITNEKEYNKMNKIMKDVPVGCEGLINFPFGNGAERIFNNKIIGSHFINLNFNKHGKAHLYRSAIEGIAFSFAYGIELMKEDQSLINVIKAGNDNLFQSKVFVETLCSIIGNNIQIYNTNGAIGAARASTIEGNNFDYFKKSSTGNDLVSEYEPKKSNEEYILAYEKWKKELNKKIKT